ncbi:Uncharacterised protein [Mycobacteroides abscessus]|nr:Uncharacterised protein [Mycobacteroides abscessus]
MERARHVVALDGALRQIATHVAAIAVEHLDVALGVGEYHQFGAERVDRVGLTVPERLCDAQAVPTACVARGELTDVDLANADSCGVCAHGGAASSVSMPVAVATTFN